MKTTQHKIKFIVVSDFHCRDKLSNDKKEIINRIINEIKEPDSQITSVIMPGDLTNNGYDGMSMFGYKYGGEQNQLGVLHHNIIEPLEEYTNVYLCAGNHDTYTKRPYFRKPVLRYIKHRHGDIRYEFKYHYKGNPVLRFICLGIYPDKKSREFLKCILHKHPKDSYIIIFHYVPLGPFGDWWGDVEKKEFLNMISGYNIVAILAGHVHTSGIVNWKNIIKSEKYPVILAAGDKYALCEYNNETNELKVEFK